MDAVGAMAVVSATGEASLSRRELDVPSLTVAGITSTRDLADHLVISDNTVKHYLRNILNKLHLHNRAAVVSHAVRYGLMRSPPPDHGF